MQFDESKHPRDNEGKFTDKGGGEAKRVFDLADELGVPYDRNTSYQTLKARVDEAQKQHQSLKSALDTLDTYSNDRKNSIESNPLFRVAQSYDDVKTFIEEVPRMKGNEYLFLGLINSEYAKRIEQETGLNTKNKSIAISRDSIRHIYNNHGEFSPKNETKRGQIPVNNINVENIVLSIIKPDEMERSDENDMKGIVFRKSMRNNITAVTYVSEKRGYLALRTGWINK